MRRTLLWVVALAVTVASAAWQRWTGPTYPVAVSAAVGATVVKGRLERSHGGPGDQPVRLQVGDGDVSGEVAWRRYPTAEPWTVQPLTRAGEWLEGVLPHQPPAGKLEYQVRLGSSGKQVVVPERPAVTRFKGEVAAAVLIPHILAMFLGMLWSSRAGLEALRRDGLPGRFAAFTLGTIIVGGFVFGPLVQKAAFGSYWTGVPFGWDLTDNKTLLAGLAWAWALWRARRDPADRLGGLIAALVTLGVFAIPHSAWGSQVDWATLPAVGVQPG